MLKFRISSIAGSDCPPVSHPSFPAYVKHNMSCTEPQAVYCVQNAPNNQRKPHRILTYKQHDLGQLAERVVHHRVTAVIGPFCILHMQSRSVIEASM